MRLDKFLAHTGFGTRKEVKKIIKDKRVCVDDELIRSDKYQIDEKVQKVYVDGQVVKYQEFVYYMLNKPAGYVSATIDNVYPTVVSLIDEYYGDDLFPIGRLDVDTEGLLILSNDGQLAHKLTSPKYHCPKVYYAKIKGIVDEHDIQVFKDGISLEDFDCQSAILEILSTEDGFSEIEVTIYEGKFHQVKRMFQSVGKEVVYLKRIQMKDLSLDEMLELGEYRQLELEELDRLSI